MSLQHLQQQQRRYNICHVPCPANTPFENWPKSICILGLLVGLCEVAACEVGCGMLGGGADICLTCVISDICLTCVIYCTSLDAPLLLPTVSSAHAKSEVPALASHCSLSLFFVLAYTTLSLSSFLSSRYRLKCSAQGDHGAIDAMLHLRKTQKYLFKRIFLSMSVFTLTQC